MQFLNGANKCKLFSALILLFIGLSSLIWTPFDLFMDERLNMRPGTPAFIWWKDPPAEVKLKLYIFNVTNAERFLQGEDKKMMMEEIGPIIFREKWTHRDVVFNENSTMSYTINHTAIYVPEWNTIDLNASLVVPNMAVLVAASYLWDAPFFTKIGFNYIISSLQSKTIVNTTVYNFLYNNTDRMLDMGNTFFPSTFPMKNLGVIKMIYERFSDSVNAFIGKKFDHEKFSLIEKYAGSDNVPGHDDDCKNKVRGSSEGVIFNQYVTKRSVLRYYRKSLCRVIPLYYDKELRKYGVKAYKFSMPGDSYDRMDPLRDDCNKGDPVLLNGLSDLSMCFFTFPLAASNPHFLHGDPKLKDCADGMKPNSSLHSSYVYVEPLSGIPLESRARSQSNIVMRPLSGFHEMFDKFNDTTVPLFWLEYGMDDLPYFLVYLVYFVANVLPIGQWVLSALLFVSGAFVLWRSVRKPKRKISLSVPMNKIQT